MIKNTIMGTTELKTQINQYLEQVDENLLRAIHAMLYTYVQEHKEPIIGYDIAGKPVKANDAKKQYAKDIAAVENGEFISIDDLKKKSKQWLKPTK